MFRITDNKGFQVTFPNNVTVSVQWGPGNYGSNYHDDIGSHRGKDILESSTAEIAIWIEGDRNWITGQWHDSGSEVAGYLSPAEVLDALNWAAGYTVTPATDLEPTLGGQRY